MRILHGYTSIGLIAGLLTCLLAMRLMLKAHHWPKACLAVLWLLANALLLVVNTWIAFQGMGIPNGNLFHLAVAVVISVNGQLVLQMAPSDNTSVTLDYIRSQGP